MCAGQDFVSASTCSAANPQSSPTPKSQYCSTKPQCVRGRTTNDNLSAAISWICSIPWSHICPTLPSMAARGGKASWPLNGRVRTGLKTQGKKKPLSELSFRNLKLSIPSPSKILSRWMPDADDCDDNDDDDYLLSKMVTEFSHGEKDDDSIRINHH